MCYFPFFIFLESHSFLSRSPLCFRLGLLASSVWCQEEVEPVLGPVAFLFSYFTHIFKYCELSFSGHFCLPKDFPLIPAITVVN